MRKLIFSGIFFTIFSFMLTVTTAFAWPTKYLTGVTVYDASKAYNGYTLWAEQNKAKGATEDYSVSDAVFLMDMHGKVVHKWVTPYPVWYAQLLKDGTLLVALRMELDKKKVPLKDDYSHMGGSFHILMELSWDGKILRQYRNPAMHHDFRKLDNGNYMFLSWEAIPAEFQKKIKGGPSGSELDGERMYGDTFVEVNPDTGEVVWTWSSMENMDPVIEVIGSHYGRSEWTHFNTLDVMDNGDIMTDSRRTDAAYIINRKTGKVEWRWGNTVYWNEKTQLVDFHWTAEGEVNAPYLGGPHDCHVIDAGLPGAGNMLCYDNGMYADRSRAVEVNIATNKVVWESSGNTFIGRNAYSAFISGAQRLPNGNTFICDGAHGLLREVTPGNEVVWEYVRPTGNSGYLKWALFRALRYGPDYAPQLKALGDAKRSSIDTPDVSKLNVMDLLKK